MPDDINGWREWSKFVLKELERLNDCYDKQQRDLRQNSLDLAQLKIKVAVIAGGCGVAGGTAVKIVSAFVGGG